MPRGTSPRWPDPHTGKAIRVEHWAVAERQGQTAARNILGAREPFTAVPFFWSQHYDLSIHYVGHAEAWERVEISGSVANGSCLVAYWVAGRNLGGGEHRARPGVPAGGGDARTR